MENLINVLMFPVYVVFFILFLVIWMVFTLSGVGPIGQFICKQYDNSTLDMKKILAANSDIHVVTVPGTVNSATGGRPYNMVCRYTARSDFNPDLPPVCLPNGLGATLVLISPWQEELVRKGYRVLSFDRLGVGFSDDNPTGQSPTAADVVREMDYAMNHFLPAHTKWILVGGSMGSIVAQCYISVFPQKVVGFLNMDGLPYPFIKFKSQFISAGGLYKIYTYIIWTGILRPFIGMSVGPMEKHLVSDAFPAKFVKAQLNQSRFFGNIGIEMATMMHLCEFGATAWGALDLLKMDAASLQVSLVVVVVVWW